MKVLLTRDDSFYAENGMHVDYHKVVRRASFNTDHFSIVSDLGLNEPKISYFANSASKVGEYRHLVEIITVYHKDPIIVRLDFNSGHYKDFVGFLEYIKFKD